MAENREPREVGIRGLQGRGEKRIILVNAVMNEDGDGGR